jgi:hypothetical protein
MLDAPCLNPTEVKATVEFCGNQRVASSTLDDMLGSVNGVLQTDGEYPDIVFIFAMTALTRDISQRGRQELR